MNPESQAFVALEPATNIHGTELISFEIHHVYLSDLSSIAREVELFVFRAIRKPFPIPRLSKLISFPVCIFSDSR